MSFRNWLSHPPIGVGIIVALALGALALSNNYQQSECRNQPSKQDCRDASGKMYETRIAPIASRPNEPPARKPNPARDEWRTESDLDAQWQMANWALLSAIAAWVALFVTAGGLVLLYKTLAANRDAVAAANRTADEAKRIGEAQVRAYLSCEGATYTVSDKWLACEVIVRNNGQSPAIWTEIQAIVCTRPRSTTEGRIGFENVISESTAGRGPAIAAGQNGTIFLIWSHIEMGEGAHDSIWKEDRKFDIRCRVNWRDVFSRKNTHSFFLDVAHDGDRIMFDSDERKGGMTAHNSDSEYSQDTD